MELRQIKIIEQHAGSSYGIPMVTHNGQAVNPGDLVAGRAAAEIVAGWAVQQGADVRRLAARWLAQSPEWVGLARAIAGAATAGRRRLTNPTATAHRRQALAAARVNRWK
jgi:hypothetical protein